MIQRRESLRLALEPRRRSGRRRNGAGKDLDRDLALSRVSLARNTSPIPPSPIDAMTS